MKIWLYKRCKLYRKLFAEELAHRYHNRWRDLQRTRLKSQMEIASRVFNDEIKSGHFDEAIITAAFILYAYNKL